MVGVTYSLCNKYKKGDQYGLHNSSACDILHN